MGILTNIIDNLTGQKKIENKKTKIITAMYTDVKGFPFFAHEAIARHDRYLHSLRTLSNTGEEIIVYCNQTQYQLLVDHCRNFKLDNVTIKVSNIQDYPNCEKMFKIKQKSNKFHQFHEIDWNKIYLMEKEFDEMYDYIYWVDIGISHHGIFLTKYNPYFNLCDGMSSTFECYSNLNLFNSELFPKINQYIGDRLLNLSNQTWFHNMHETGDILNINYGEKGLSVGGFLGGHTSKLKWFFNEFKIIGDIFLDNEYIINHEALISFIVQENKNNFKTYLFDTWYHDDFVKTYDKFDVNFLKDKVHFVHFFEKELKM